MAKVDREVYLVVLRNVDDRLLVLHVNGHKLVADFGRVLCIINQTELLVSNVVFHFWIVLQFDAFTLDLLSPAILVEALAEEDHVGEHSFVVSSVESVAHPVQVKGEDLVHEHLLTIVVG